MKTIQYFSDEYLERCKQMSTTDIINFLEDFRLLYGEQEGAERLKRIRAEAADWLPMPDGDS